MGIRRSVVAVGMLIALGGCDGGVRSAGPDAGATTPGATAGSVGAGPTGCVTSGSHGAPPSCPADNRYRDDELAGTPAVLWALLFLTGDGLPAGEQAKIALRMTGSGELSLRAVGPGGVTVAPADGPDPHDGSNWDRPGDEWGTYWVFPAPGCWTIHADRTDGTRATLTLRAG